MAFECRSQHDRESVVDLTGYELEPLHDDGDFSLYRARLTSHPSSVLARVAARTSAQSRTRLEHEYGLAPLLDRNWAAQPLMLYRLGEPPMLVLDDDGGEPLQRLLG